MRSGSPARSDSGPRARHGRTLGFDFGRPECKLVRAIHVFLASIKQDVDARDSGVLSTPFFERLCAGMTAGVVL